MFDPNKIERWDKSRDGTWPMDECQGGDYIRSEDYDALNLQYNNLLHFMRRMAEQYGFGMEDE